MKELNSKLKSNEIVGYFEDEDIINHFEKDVESDGYIHWIPQGTVAVLEELISPKEALALVESFNNADVEAVETGDNGYKNSYEEGSRVHSLRKTLYSKELANILFERIAYNLDPIEHEGGLYRPTGVNPAFRFIKYVNDGFLVPHYDFPYVFEGGMTLKTLVLNLTDSDAKTIFIDEHRENDLTDLTEMPDEDDILLEFESKIENALLFDHKMLHAGTNSSNKIIIRTDIMYVKVGDI